MINIGIALLLIGTAMIISFYYFCWSWKEQIKHTSFPQHGQLYYLLLPVRVILTSLLAVSGPLLLVHVLLIRNLRFYFLIHLLIITGLLLIVFGATSSLPLTFLTLLGVGVILFLWYLFTHHFQKISFFLYEMTIGNIHAFLRSHRKFPDSTRTTAVFNHKPRVIQSLAWLPASKEEEQPERIILAERIHLSSWQPRQTIVFLNEYSSGSNSSEILGSTYGTITDIAVSPDHNYIASCSPKGYVEFCPSKYSLDAAIHPLEEHTIVNGMDETAILNSIYHYNTFPSVGVNAITWAPHGLNCFVGRTSRHICSMQ